MTISGFFFLHCEIINLKALARKQFVYAFPFQNLHKTLAKLGKIPLESSKQIQQEKKSSPQVNLVNDAQSQKKPETEASTPVQSSVAKLPEISAVVKNQSQSVEVKASQQPLSKISNVADQVVKKASSIEPLKPFSKHLEESKINEPQGSLVKVQPSSQKTDVIGRSNLSMKSVEPQNAKVPVLPNQEQNIVGKSLVPKLHEDPIASVKDQPTSSKELDKSLVNKPQGLNIRGWSDPEPQGLKIKGWSSEPVASKGTESQPSIVIKDKVIIGDQISIADKQFADKIVPKISQSSLKEVGNLPNTVSSMPLVFPEEKSKTIPSTPKEIQPNPAARKVDVPEQRLNESPLEEKEVLPESIKKQASSTSATTLEIKAPQETKVSSEQLPIDSCRVSLTPKETDHHIANVEGMYLHALYTLLQIVMHKLIRLGLSTYASYF